MEIPGSKKFQEAFSFQTHLKKKNFNLKMNFVPAGTDPDGPSGTQVFAGKPDAYMDPDTD